MIRRILPVVAIALLGACSTNTAQTPEPGSPNTSRMGNGEIAGRGAQRQDMTLIGINLTPDQQLRIDAIRAKYRTQMQESRKQGGDRTAMRGMMEKQMTDIREVLLPDQQPQYDKNIADMRARMQQGGMRRPNG